MVLRKPDLVGHRPLFTSLGGTGLWWDIKGGILFELT